MIISFVNQKGGVGKSTLAISIAYELAIFHKKKVLLIDADEQHSIIDWSEIREDILPTNLVVIGLPKKNIHRDIDKIAEPYEMVIIDTPGRITEITKSAILGSDVVIIPCTPSPYDVWSSQDSLQLAEEAKIYKEHLKIGFAINRKIVNTKMGEEVREALQQLDSRVKIFNTHITQRVGFATSASLGLSIQEFDEEGKSALEINTLTTEILGMLT